MNKDDKVVYTVCELYCGGINSQGDRCKTCLYNHFEDDKKREQSNEQGKV